MTTEIRNVLILAAIPLLALAISTYDRNKDWQSKVELYTDAWRKSPTKIRPAFLLARAYYDEQKFIMAASFYGRVLQMCDYGLQERTDVGFNYCDASTTTLATIIMDSGDLATARTMLTEMANRDSTSEGVYLNLGVLSIRENKPNEALEWIDRAVNKYHATNKDPETPEVWVNRAYAYLQLGRCAEAQVLFEKFVKWYPDFRIPDCFVR